MVRIATFNEINQKLQCGEIERWFINLEQQISRNKPNLRISFLSKDGRLYPIRARHD
jgi:hypothetical protein